jgi:hypothetical protein
MHQSWIFGSMLATGFALFATAAKIEADRSTFTSPQAAPEPPLRASVASLKVDKVEPVVVEDDYVVELPQVEIVGKRSRARARPQPRLVLNEPQLATEPCSRWEELGPQRVDDGNGIGVHRVRSLCLGPMQGAK